MRAKVQMKVEWHGRELDVKIQKGVNMSLGRIAGLVRRLARRSLRTGTKRRPSVPGAPPHSIKDPTKGHRIRMIYYAKVKDGVWVVGPTLLTPRKGFGKPTPAVHEHGGTRTIEYLADPVLESRVKRRKLSKADKARLREAIARESQKPGFAKDWTDRRSFKARRLGLTSFRQSQRSREAFWVKVEAGKIKVHSAPGTKPQKKVKVRMYPKRPFMSPALRNVVPVVSSILQNSIR